MKKVLSVALASAMVLGMGANAFAISYSTGTNDEADWPTDFQFDGELFVTNKDGDIIEEASTALNDSESVDFEPGDVIWMPLYAEDQKVYDAEWTEGTDGDEAISGIKLEDAVSVETHSNWKIYKGQDGKYYDMNRNPYDPSDIPAGYVMVEDAKIDDPSGQEGKVQTYVAKKATLNTIPDTIEYDGKTRTVVENSERYYVGSTRYKDVDEFLEAAAKNPSKAYVTVNVEEIESTDDEIGKPYVDEENSSRVAYGHYTGNIDKNWSINLIEKSTGVAELIEKAELYKATATDYASYSKYTDEIMPNAVYLKITLKDTWKTVDEETLTYYVYIADNDSKSKTNEVWVSGTYANNDWEYVDFDWTNDASKATLWKVKKGENGTAVFDFADKAFFTVKMYSGESMYLDLSTAYDKAIAGEMDAEADSFYKFDNDNANFSRTGELIIVTDDSSLVPYEIDEDGNFVEVDAKYVEDYAIAHTNKKVDGFVFSTKTLGNYVLSTEKLGQEEEPVDETPVVTPVVEEPTTETPATDNTTSAKPNPATGAEDFVGLAVSLAVVSVAAAGALALKK